MTIKNTGNDDNNDFFDTLERQLAAATADRTRRLRRARNRTIATLSTILLALLVAGGGLAVALTDGSGTDTTNNTPAASHQTVPPPPASITVHTPSAVGRCARAYQRARFVGTDPSSVTVAVLNATTVPGLARGVATRLQNDHYKIGTVTNAATLDRTTTRVYFADHRCIAAATQVAEALGFQGSFALQAMPKAVAIIAGGSADVAVVVGSDQNQTTG